MVSFFFLFQCCSLIKYLYNDAFHRKQLKRVVGIRYPEKITNKALYKQCNERPLSLYVLENRWRLFGHILRRDREIPAYKAMEGFFVPQGNKYRGRPITTLPVVLNNDLSRLESSTYCLKTFKDIENLKKIAEQRDQWRILCTRIQPRRCSLTTMMRNGDKSSKSYSVLTNWAVCLGESPLQMLYISPSLHQPLIIRTSFYFSCLSAVSPFFLLFFFFSLTLYQSLSFFFSLTLCPSLSFFLSVSLPPSL